LDCIEVLKAFDFTPVHILCPVQVFEVDLQSQNSVCCKVRAVSDPYGW